MKTNRKVLLGGKIMGVEFTDEYGKIHPSDSELWIRLWIIANRYENGDHISWLLNRARNGANAILVRNDKYGYVISYNRPKACSNYCMRIPDPKLITEEHKYCKDNSAWPCDAYEIVVEVKRPLEPYRDTVIKILQELAKEAT